MEERINKPLQKVAILFNIQVTQRTCHSIHFYKMNMILIPNACINWISKKTPPSFCKIPQFHKVASKCNAIRIKRCISFFGIKNMSAKHKIKLFLTQIHNIWENYIVRICLRFVTNSQEDVFSTAVPMAIVWMTNAFVGKVWVEGVVNWVRLLIGKRIA